jgi:hypothetical protein
LKGGLQGDTLFGGGGQRDVLDGGGGAQDWCNDPHRPTRFKRCETVSNARG